MPRWKKISLITVGVILGLLLLSMLIVPWQIKKQGSAWFAENTSRKLQIEKAYFNPFTLTLEVNGLKLSEQDSDKAFVAFSRLMLSGSVRSIIDQAIILDRVELDQPYANIELLGKQEFNFSDFTRLGGDQPETSSTEPSEPLLFSFNNIVVTGGQIDFSDHLSVNKSQHQVRELSLAVPFVGNVPYLTDEYVKPHLRLLLNGSELRAGGQLKPFDQSLETSLSFELTDIDLSFYALHSPVPLPVEVKSGVLDSQIELTYRVSDTQVPQLLINGELALSDIDVRESNGDNLFLLPTLFLEAKQADLLDQSFDLHSLEIYQPQLFVKRDQEGRLNLLNLLPENSPPAAEPAAEEKSQPAKLPLVTLTQLVLADGAVHLQDDYPSGGFKETVQGINLRLDNLSTYPEQLTELNFKLQTARELNFSLAGQFGLNPLSGDLALLLNGFQLKPHYPYFSDLLTQPLEGNLNLASNIQFGPEISLRLDQMQLGLQQLNVPFSKEDRFTLKDLSIAGGSFDLEQQLMKIGSITLKEGSLIASRAADGKLSPLALLREKQQESAAAEKSAPTTVELPWQKKAAQIDPSAFKLQLEGLALEKFALQFSDASLPKKPRLKIDQFNASLKNLAYPESKQSPFSLSVRIGRGQIDSSGHLTHSPLRLQSQTKINAFPLTIINDFRPENLRTELNEGKLSSDLAVTLQQGQEAFTGSFSGRLNISEFHVSDPLSDGELLSWGQLGLDGIKGEIAPFKLAIKEVSLSDYLAKILITETGEINLASITAKSEAKEETEGIEQTDSSAAVDSASGSTETLETSEPLDIQVDAVTLQGGTVSFTDHNLSSIFTTTMYKLGGQVTGLSAEEEMQADVDLQGQLENHSPLTITGKLNPLSKNLYADLLISFKDIDLAPLTPYSGTYLGYKINKGKLYLDLNYHIENRKVRAQNRVMIDQFTLGDTVKSDKATSLPLSLAIALLKDSSGEINLDLPVSGDLDDPDFGIASTIFTILKNLLVKAATSPFALLGAMFGGDEGFTSIDFAAGSDQLSNEQQQPLAKLAEMLADRPALTLEISAFADRDKDPEAYQKLQLQKLLLEAKALELAEKGQAVTSEERTISDQEYPKYLTEVYKSAEFERPRNFIGLLKTLPVEEMEELLLANIRADDEQMQNLAKNRAMAVRDTLYADNEKIKGQIFLTNVDIYQKPESGPASRVEFSISSK